LVLERLATQYGDRLVVIEGAASGADCAAHNWCLRRGIGPDRHRCHPVDWAAERRARPKDWRLAGPERNTRMLLDECPRLIIAFHDHLSVESGGTSDMCARGLIRDVPVWLVPGGDASVGRWLRLELFPTARISRIRRELGFAAPTPGMTIF